MRVLQHLIPYSDFELFLTFLHVLGHSVKPESAMAIRIAITDSTANGSGHQQLIISPGTRARSPSGVESAMAIRIAIADSTANGSADQPNPGDLNLVKNLQVRESAMAIRDFNKIPMSYGSRR